MLTISQRAIDLIVVEEDSGETYYTRHYEHLEWPAGASGPTEGIGYDLGYQSPAQVRLDWQGIVSEEMLAAMLPACGLKGVAARDYVRARGSSVTITWDQAIRQFTEREIPKIILQTSNALPNCDLLSPDSLGALGSLTYNRGPGGYANSVNSRFAEMYAIRQHMADKNFAAITAEFYHMRRLWPVGGDLWKRRGHEAMLYEAGLAKAA